MTWKSYRKWMSVVFVFSLFGVACTQNITPEESCHFVMNSQQQRVSWSGTNRSIQVAFVLEDADYSYSEELEKAIATWNQSFGGANLLEYVGVVPKEEMGEYDIKVFWEKRWSDSNKEEQAKTLVQWRGDQIYSALIGINVVHNHFFTGDVGVKKSVDFRALMVHELGHALGLSHIEHTKGSVMYPSLATGYTGRRKPTDEDLSFLGCEY